MLTHRFTILSYVLLTAGCSRDAGTTFPDTAPRRAESSRTGPRVTPSGPAADAPKPRPSESPSASQYQGRPLSVWLIDLKSGDPSVRLHAVEAVGLIGPDAPQVVLALTRAIEDEDAHVRSAAVDQLGRFGPASRDAVPALVVALNDTKIDVRWKAAEALGAIGPAAKSAVPALAGALEDEVPNVRSHAGEALLKIDPDAAKQAGVR